MVTHFSQQKITTWRGIKTNQKFKQINQSNSKELINKYLIIFTDKIASTVNFRKNLIKFKFGLKLAKSSLQLILK